MELYLTFLLFVSSPEKDTIKEKPPIQEIQESLPGLDFNIHIHCTKKKIIKKR